MDKIFWYNKKVYDRETILRRIKFVVRNMKSLLPLNRKEKKKLISYAKKHKIPEYEMYSLRNIIKVQKEIKNSRFIKSREKEIKRDFIKLVNFILNNENSNSHIMHFIKLQNLPFNTILKIINKMPEFNKLSHHNLLFIDGVKREVKKNEIQILENAISFEKSLEKYLVKKGLKFRTEEQIHIDGDYNITPDILFDEPIILEVDGNRYSIRWMDAKNYILVKAPFIMKNLTKQADKYYNTFGLGAFVFHYGFDESIKIENAIILDGSFL